MPRELLYADQEWIKWILIFAVIFFVIPFFVYKSLNRLISPTWIATCLAFASPLINGPTFGIYIGGKEETELKENGAWTTGQVIGKKFVTMSKRSDYWAIQSEFRIDSKTYRTDWDQIEEKAYKIGDRIDIIYLKDYPKIHRIKDEWRKSN